LTTLGAASSQAHIQGPIDLEDDVTAGFDLISTWDLDERGVEWIAEKIKARVGSGPVVISLDVDVLDPSYVPASESSPFYRQLTS
jgi:agmatinase